jgi:hypothetical protein
MACDPTACDRPMACDRQMESDHAVETDRPMEGDHPIERDHPFENVHREDVEAPSGARPDVDLEADRALRQGCRGQADPCLWGPVDPDCQGHPARCGRGESVPQIGAAFRPAGP